MVPLNCFIETLTTQALPIYCLQIDQIVDWLEQQPEHWQNWLYDWQHNANSLDSGQFCYLPDIQGRPEGVLLLVKDLNDIDQIGCLAQRLKEGDYYLASPLNDHILKRCYLYWGLGSYQFKRYSSKLDQGCARLCLNQLNQNDIDDLHIQLKAIYWVRHLINTPAEDMGPEQLAQEAYQLAQHYQAQCDITVGSDLLEHNYPAIHRVGRAAEQKPRLIDIKWGDANAPKITLVGKGVCFDTGGLDIKPGSNMRMMKKDMGGAAHVLGLAAMIMQSQLPIRLRILVPAVDNAISGNAYRPSDIICMRNGQYVEVTNTDAEGRLVMADAITAACEETPELLIDYATLTGAARVAMGTEIAPFFTPQTAIAKALYTKQEQTHDPVWQLPLHQSYKKLLKSSIADCVNANVSSPYAGAITAALFLQQFLTSPSTQWLHFDVMGFNMDNRPGHPYGGEAMGLRTVFEWLKTNYLQIDNHD